MTTLMATGIDSAMHLRSHFRFFYFLEISRPSLLFADKFITHSGVQNRLRMFELLDLLQASNSLHFKLVVYMKIQLESRRLQEQANTGTSVLSFQ